MSEQEDLEFRDYLLCFVFFFLGDCWRLKEIDSIYILYSYVWIIHLYILYINIYNYIYTYIYRRVDCLLRPPVSRNWRCSPAIGEKHLTNDWKWMGSRLSDVIGYPWDIGEWRWLLADYVHFCRFCCTCCTLEVMLLQFGTWPVTGVSVTVWLNSSCSAYRSSC